MLKYIPYDELKKNKRAYEIMMLRDQLGNTFADIAKKYQLSATRVNEIYEKQKFLQKQLYINHIALSFGHESIAEIKKVYLQAEECYQSQAYACAYLEKKYEDILTEYRKGEPGMPSWFMKLMPPFKIRLNKKTIERIVEMREKENASFRKIAKEMNITRAKAAHTYDWFYHEKVLKIIKTLEKQVKTPEEKFEIWDKYFIKNTSSKKRYDMLTKK